ncbi:MAG: serine protease [Caldilineaceae bacterium]|nr:serine protease [Caldilineaceae bacterium]
MKPNPRNNSAIILILICLCLLSACTIDSNQLAGTALLQTPADSSQTDPNPEQHQVYLPLVEQNMASDPNAAIPEVLPVAEEPADVQAAVVGGTAATPGEYPWQAMLMHKGSFYCGGSLIEMRWVLTAAHCLVGYAMKDLQVVLGAHDRTATNEASRQRFSPIRIIVHPSYSPATLANDIGLIQLDKGATVTRSVDFIRLDTPTAVNVPASFNLRFQVVTTGWGRLNASGPTAIILQKVTLPIVPNDVCKQTYGAYITDNVICAGLKEGGKGSCNGDSGGPLVQGQDLFGKLIGVTSFGGTQCAGPLSYTVFTRVANYTDWIRQTVGGIYLGR